MSTALRGGGRAPVVGLPIVTATRLTDLTIRPVAYDAPDVQPLLVGALAELADRYGGNGDDTPVHPDDFRPPAGQFLIAVAGDLPVGCAGWRSHGDAAELKRLYTVAAARGHGVARQLLAAVEDSARTHGRRRLILECGDRQPEAIALYRSRGYQRIENFGFYRDEPGCLSFAREL